LHKEPYPGGENIAGGKLKENSADFWVIPNTGANNESRLKNKRLSFYYYLSIFQETDCRNRIKFLK
jgi:hypothetical protein